MMARRQLRLAAIAALSTIEGVEVLDSVDWDVPLAKFPAIRVRTGVDRKVSNARGMPQFTSTMTLELQIAAVGNTSESAQDNIEDIGLQVENMLFGNPGLTKIVQQFSTVTTVPTFTSEGNRHLAGLAMSIDCEVFESYDPYLIDPTRATALRQIGVHLDAINVADPSGAYANPPFPSSVTPAPRTSGPDGRDEGALNINLTQ